MRTTIAVVGFGVALLVAVPLASGAEEAPPAAQAAVLKGACGACHHIPGIPGANGQVGPDLAEIGAAASARRDGLDAEAYIRQSIVEPNAFIAPACPSGPCPPGVMLQSFGTALAADELDAIVGYLASLGTGKPVASGPAPPTRLSRELPPESRVRSYTGAAAAAPKAAEVALGKSLFFDTRLSGNRSRSCASCHQPARAWTEGAQLSQGYPSTAYFRNTPTLLNVAQRERLFWDGRLDGADLPTLVRDHLTEAHFMNMDGRLVSERLKQVPAYVERFEEVYGQEPRFGGIINSVAAYVRTLASGPAPIDAHRAGRSGALSAEARRGLALFEGKAGCVGCHAGPHLTDGEYYDVGLRTDPAVFDEPLRAVTMRRFFRIHGTPGYRRLEGDPGLFAITKNEADRRRFRTPSLREVAHTAPYMHDGSLATLADVVDFYDRGGDPTNTARVRSLGLSASEKADLVAFLEQALSTKLPEVEVPRLPAYALYELPKGKPAANGGEAPAAAARTPQPLAPLPPPPAPPDNPITEAKAELGRILYFDPRMSGDGSLSCASCHPPGTGWGAPGALSFGYPGTVHWRNASTVLNVAYYTKLNWDGKAKSIEAQNKGAWTGAVAGNLDSVMGEERLAQIPGYVERFRAVFGTERPRFEDALRAVATYQRTLNSKPAPLDAHLGGDASALDEAAKRGLALFEGKAGCIGCHDGALLSDQGFYALGVPMHEDFHTNPLRQITFRWETWVKGANEKIYRSANEDLGLYFVTKQKSDQGRFRTPSLRDVCYTGPYMHNGVLASLEDVVAFYDGGGGAHPNKDPRIRPLGLAASERADLVAFLNALCGERIVDQAPELPPYAPGYAPRAAGGEVAAVGQEDSR